MSAERVDLAARFAAPGERDLPPGRHDLHREILMNHMLSQPPTHQAAPRGRRRSRPRTLRGHGRLLAAVAAGTALAGGVAGYVITAGHAPAAPKAPAAAGSQPAGHSPTGPGTGPGTGSRPLHATLAAKILGAAATHVAASAVAEPKPGQWIYYETVDYSYPGNAQSSGISTDQEWTTFDGSGSAYYAGGQVVTHTSTVNLPAPGLSAWAAWNADSTPKTAYDVLAALPASPRALLAVIADHAAGQSASDIEGNPIAGRPPTTEAQREFDVLTEILWNAAPGAGGPAGAEAAAYRALATLPGISVKQGVKDSAGGRAIGVSDDGGYDQLLIDPVSYRVIGIRNLSTGVVIPGKGGQAAKGALEQEIVYTRNTVVAAPGDH
ncbi:MAG TPA: CU044_5270 family protein [Trebonia sp.]|jgi:hypothetical protein|nr:CU044_5270 family protein [Trebonia sp.]